MKKIILCLLALALLWSAALPFCTLVTAENTSLWNGNTASGFAGGDGSENDPFRIENAEQLSFFAQSVKDGELYSGKHVRLCADIRLNDETFSFEPDTGLVKVTDGTNTAYCGTGRAGDDSGDDTRFDTTASTLGIWYDGDGKEIMTYPGTLYALHSLYFFAGSFHGAGHTVSGMYIKGNGLFANMKLGKLIGIHLQNSLIVGNHAVGSILGTASENTVTVQYCRFSGIVLGNADVGGIAGNAEKNVLLSGCENSGTVIGGQNVGGIAGYGYGMDYCINKGNIYGSKNTGGIVGSGSVVDYSTNTGIVTGGNGVGGICGTIGDSATHCHNLGNVYGSYRVGGICGVYSDYEKSNVFYCYNNAAVQGENYVGGIAGVCPVNTCQNDGDVTGKEYVGGIAGQLSVIHSQNNGAVSGQTCVGGVLGSGNVSGCGNYGKVSGDTRVGGVAGSTNYGMYDCFNRGDVVGNQIVGGIMGSAGTRSEGGYNTGKVLGQDDVGALVGKAADNAVLRCLYYLENCAVNTEGEVQTGVSGRRDYAASNICAVTEQELRQADIHTDLDFLNTWEITDTYPIQQYVSRYFDAHQTAELEKDCYLYTPVNCDKISYYRTSCKCGAVLDGLFEGKTKNHYPADGTWKMDDRAHWQVCGRCNNSILAQSHAFAKGTFDQNGESSAVILPCEICGYEKHIPYTWQEPAADPSATPETTTQKAELKLDARFVLLLVAGVVLGAMGSYGVMTVRTMRNESKHKKKNFI